MRRFGEVLHHNGEGGPSEREALWVLKACATYVRHQAFVSGALIRRHRLDPRRRKVSTHPAPAEATSWLLSTAVPLLPDTSLLLRRLDQRLSLFDLARATDPLGQVTRPVVHQDTPAFEQVGAEKIGDVVELLE